MQRPLHLRPGQTAKRAGALFMRSTTALRMNKAVVDRGLLSAGADGNSLN
jgi:hypothetical protein